MSTPAPPSAAQQGQTALSFGSTIVNGETQPAFPLKMTWATIYFPPKVIGEKGFLGMGGGGVRPAEGVPPQMPGYEPSVSSDSNSSSDNIPPIIPMEIPQSALPQSASGKRMPFTKSTPPNALPRPKNNLRSSNSTFVTRLQIIDNLPKIMAERGKNGGEFVKWGFWNLGRTFAWAEEGGRVKVRNSNWMSLRLC